MPGGRGAPVLRFGGYLFVAAAGLVEAPKTKQLVAKLKEMELSSALIITEAMEQNLYMASRNLADVQVIDVAAIDPVSLLRYDNVVLTAGAVKRFEEWLK